MNLILSFVHPGKPAREIGGFQSVSLDADVMRDVARDAVVARHRDHQWEFEGERYFRLDASTPVRIHFERQQPFPRDAVQSRRFGPFARFSAIDGIAYTDDRVFAFVDTRLGDWFCYDDGRHWTLMVVSETTDRSKEGLLSMLMALAPHLPGVVGFWQGLQLAYLGRTESIRTRLEASASAIEDGVYTSVTWEAHDAPLEREAQLLAEYATGAKSLVETYGFLHGNRVRTSRLIERAHELVARARRLRARAEPSLA